MLQSLTNVPVIPVSTVELVLMELITTPVPVLRHFLEISVKVIITTCFEAITLISDKLKATSGPSRSNLLTSSWVHAILMNNSILTKKGREFRNEL